MDPVDLLLDELTDRGGKWPPPRELPAWSTARTYRAFLESDRDSLKIVHGWPSDRDYKVDPLGELIADAWADHLFGDGIGIEPATDADAARLDFLIGEPEEFVGDLHSGERIVVGEGEAWWRIYVDTEVDDKPILEWHTRDEVIPLYIAGRLMAVALVTELDRRPRERTARWRHFEVHVRGAVEHVLFKGTERSIGHTVPLEEHPDTEELAGWLGAQGGGGQRWDHGLGFMLMGRVANRRRGRDPRAGVSDFHPIRDYLLDLNEAAFIGAQNARLTARKRVVVDEDSVRPRSAELVDRGDGMLVPARGGPTADFDAGEDVLVRRKLDAELGNHAEAPFKVLEYSFDAEALIAYTRDRVETAVTRIGLTPQYIGATTTEGAGYAVSGTALRLRLIPTVRAGRGKLRAWNLPDLLSRMALVDALPVERGGFGRPWTTPADPPSVEFANPLPRDPVEDATVEATLLAAGAKSVRQSVVDQHPDWDDELVDDEVELIRADRAATRPVIGA